MIARRSLLLLGLGGLGLAGGGYWGMIRQPVTDNFPGLPPLPDPRPGQASSFKGVDPTENRIVYTVDDGTNPKAVKSYVDMAVATGMRMVYCPNYAYRESWVPVASKIGELLLKGQVQIVNHTANHVDLTEIPLKAAKQEVTSNEDWINETWGVTSRPWFRPPYGKLNNAIMELLGELGYTRILLWNASLSDYVDISEDEYMNNVYSALFPGAIVLSHANTNVSAESVYRVREDIKSKSLRPITLDDAFYTSRGEG